MSHALGVEPVRHPPGRLFRGQGGRTAGTSVATGAAGTPMKQRALTGSDRKKEVVKSRADNDLVNR